MQPASKPQSCHSNTIQSDIVEGTTHHDIFMAKIQRLDAPDGAPAAAPANTRPAPVLTEFEYTLSDRTVLVFREPTVADMEQVSGESGTAVRQAMRLASRCCKQWGKFPGGSLPQFEQARGTDVAAIAAKFNLADNDPTWVSHPDGSIEIALSTEATATLRPLTLADVRHTERSRGSDFHQSILSVARVCLDWAGGGPISVEELRKQPARDFVSVAKIMGQQNQWDTNEIPDYDEGSDYSKEFTTPGGIKVILRDVTGGDLDWIEDRRAKADAGKISQSDFIAGMIARLCAGWNASDRIEIEELDAVPMRDVLAIAAVVATFR